MKSFILLILLLPFLMGMGMGPRVDLFNYASACYVDYKDEKSCEHIQGHKTTVCWCYRHRFGSITCTCMPPEAMDRGEILQYAIFWLTEGER